MAELRPNLVKHKLQQGEAVSIVEGCETPNLVEYFGQFGFDGFWIEGEHGPLDFRDIADFTRACDLWGTTSIVRVNANHEGVIYRTLDQGAQGIVVPHVNTADEAQAVVRAAKFHPLGARGMFTGRQGFGVDDYFAKANDDTLVVVLIEDIVAVNNLAEILKVDNIDVFFVAHGDLSQSMGRPGDVTHPGVLGALNGAIRQIVDAGRVAGAVANSSNAERLLAHGARFLMTSWRPWAEAGSRAYLETIAKASS